MERMKKFVRVVFLLALTICAVSLYAPEKSEAVTNTATMYIDLEGNGNITGTVGSAITPYRFTLTVKKGPAGSETPSFKSAYAAGTDVTNWFEGICDPAKNVFKKLPVGLKVKTVDAIKAGDTSATFEISGTPYMGASRWLQVTIRQSVFDGNAQHTSNVEVSNGIQMAIGRASNNISLKLSPTSMTITGTAGSAITQKELTVNLTGGNFITEYPANKDVSEWFRGSDWIMNYDGEYMTAKLPEGMSAKLKSAVKIGDTSCTFVIYGTPTYGAKEYIVPVIPEGSISFAGSDRNEHGYGPQGFGCNNDYMFNISGTTNKPGIELESLKVNGVETANITGTVGETLPDNLLTYRLKNCTLTTTYAPGHNITGFFVKWFYPSETYLFDGMGVKVEVVDFTSGRDYFTCRITGTPKRNGHGDLVVKLFEEHTSAGVRMSSMNNSPKRFGFSTPSEDANVFISSLTFDCKLGFMFDTSDTPAEIEITQGHTTEYTLSGPFKKDQDVSTLVSGLPTGVKAYSAENTSSSMPSTLHVYFKGIPTAVKTAEIHASIGGLEYFSKPAGGQWAGSSDAPGFTSETFVTINVTAVAETGFAYSYRLDPNDEGTGAVSDLSYEELKSITGTEPISLKGNISTKKFVEVENGTAVSKSKSVYSGTGLNVWVYLPQVTFGNAYNELANVNDAFRLKRITDSGTTAECPLTGYKIYTETAISKGKQTGKNILLYIEGNATSAIPSFDGLLLQVNDNGTWKDLTMPVGSEYEIGEVITGEVPVTLSNYNGLTASVGDCSINGISWSTLWDKKGVEISVSGAEFRLLHKGNDVTDWFTNLPNGMSAVVKEDVKAGSSTVKIRFGKVNSRTWKIGTVTPTQTSSDPILVTVPFSALSGDKFSNIDGGIIAAQNQNARYNIWESSNFARQSKVMIVSTEFTGTYNKNGGIGEGDTETATVYLPGSLIAQMSDPAIFFELDGQEGDFNNEYGYISCVASKFTKLSTTSENIYTTTIALYRPMITATKVTQGDFNINAAYIVSIPGGEEPVWDSRQDAQLISTYLTYNIAEPGTVLDDDDTVEHTDDDDDNGDDNELPTGEAPDIWVNGKDNKKENQYHKSMTVEVGKILASIPDDCKIVVSVTDTTVTEAEGAFSSGKGKKSNTAKAAYKKAADSVTVTAGKTVGTARVWIGAVDKKKKVQAAEYFDVLVGLAPKKIYVTKEKGAAVKDAVKSVALNMGEEITLYANSNGTELSPHSKFTWTDVKQSGCLEIVPSANTHSAVIRVISAPDNGKALKATVSVVNVESGKKVNCTIIVSNGIVEIKGLSNEIKLESAAEAVVEKKLDYTIVCADGGSTTTDKIKVFVTTALEEGSGYSNNGKKFTLTSKSKIKVTYKNGEFSLKVPKKTADGTKARVLIVVTHADKTVEVFEGGVITVGQGS